MGYLAAGGTMIEQSAAVQQPSNLTTRGSRLTYSSNSVLARQQLVSVAGFDVDVFDSATFSSDDTVLFIVPAQVTYIMTNFSVFNSSFKDTVTVTVRLVASDGANDSTSDYWEWPLGPREQKSHTVEEVLTPGYQIIAFADADALVNIKINGVNLVQQ